VRRGGPTLVGRSGRKTCAARERTIGRKIPWCTMERLDGGQKWRKRKPKTHAEGLATPWINVEVDDSHYSFLGRVGMSLHGAHPGNVGPLGSIPGVAAQMRLQFRCIHKQQTHLR